MLTLTGYNSSSYIPMISKESAECFTCPVPVVDVALGIEIPAVDGVGYTIEHFLSIGFFDFPTLWSVRDHVSQHSSSIVTHLEHTKRYQYRPISKTLVSKNPKSILDRWKAFQKNPTRQILEDLFKKEGEWWLLRSRHWANRAARRTQKRIGSSSVAVSILPLRQRCPVAPSCYATAPVGLETPAKRQCHTWLRQLFKKNRLKKKKTQKDPQRIVWMRPLGSPWDSWGKTACRCVVENVCSWGLFRPLRSTWSTRQLPSPRRRYCGWCGPRSAATSSVKINKRRIRHRIYSDLNEWIEKNPSKAILKCC